MHNFYYFYDIDGNIIKYISGNAAEAQLQLDEIAIGYVTLPQNIVGNIFRDYKIVNGEFIQKTDAEIITPDYVQKQIEIVNQMAGDIILNRFPLWKQNNMISRAVELQSLASMTTEEQAEWDTLQAAWNWIKDIRNQSNVATLAIENATSINTINQIETDFVALCQSTFN